ncbi:hypothetical protein H5410_053203 [Solanum commersonii]|uniref:Uncharacterized protein n=1 Tax=Solanum commersonii TaxID=4109 RepID=A0A9J5X6E6_SOLCO|nr:hypothetical protein H5410_053203 [Solanum commersonii]
MFNYFILTVIQPLTAQSGCPGVRKETWPELLGVPARLARETIQKENPRLTNVGNVQNGSPVTQDFRCDRVRLFINILDIVVQVPRVGLKVTWPELVGVPAKFARETIQKENSRLTIVPSVLSSSPVTADFSCNRVRLFVNVLDIVVQVPQIGVTKSSWPELLGVPAKLAREIIQKENPKLTKVLNVPNGSIVTADFRCDRVRLYVNILDFTVRTPSIG